MLLYQGPREDRWHTQIREIQGGPIKELSTEGGRGLQGLVQYPGMVTTELLPSLAL